MATQCSFDITSNVDLQEVDNALNQARKEVAQRYDFKGAKASIQGDQLRVTSSSQDDLQEAMRQLREQDFGVALQFGNYRG